MHLTNYSLNKKNEAYKFVSNADDESIKLGSTGSKRTFSFVMDYLKRDGKNTK